MADYQCPPLWWDTGSEDVGPIEPESLNISKALQQELRAWAARFDATLNRDDPGNSGGWASKEDEVLFEQQGRMLTTKLASELGPSVQVRYWRD